MNLQEYKDLAFVTSWWLQFPIWLLFFLTFWRTEWVNTQWGEIGLWRECNYSKLPEDYYDDQCWDIATASGPYFLEITRAWICVAHVAIILAIFASFCCEKTKNYSTFRGWVKFRFPEICFGITSACLMCALPQFGVNYYEHFGETRDNVELKWCFYGMCSVAGLSLIVSAGMFFGRSLPQPKESKKLSDKPSSSKSPDQKQMKSTTNSKEANEESSKSNQEEDIEVKHGVFRDIVSPNMVIMAMKRLKSGKSRSPPDVEKSPSTRRTSISSLSSGFSEVSEVNIESFEAEQAAGSQSNTTPGPALSGLWQTETKLTNSEELEGLKASHSKDHTDTILDIYNIPSDPTSQNADLPSVPAPKYEDVIKADEPVPSPFSPTDVKS